MKKKTRSDNLWIVNVKQIFKLIATFCLGIYIEGIYIIIENKTAYQP